MKTKFSPRDAVPQLEERQFPMTVEHKGSKVTILEIPNRGKPSFTITYYSEGQRQRITRREFEAAFEQAQEVASELGAGGYDVLPLSGSDRRVYERALDLLRPLGLRLDEVAAEAVELRKRLDGSGTPAEAADHFVRNRPKVASAINVRAVVEEFIESRKKEEVGKLYLRDVRLRLGDFADAFNCPIGTVTPMAIDRYLDALSVAKRTRYNYRGNIGTLMNYAKERGYLSHDFPGLLKVGKRKKFPRKVQVFTPEEMGKLLHGAKPDVALPLAITAFAGVRAEEVKKLERRHFNLVKGYIAVPADIAKNKTRRLVPIVPNLRLWLERLLPEDGLVCVYKNLSNQYLKAASKLGVTWRRNGLRHSFVSYRTADVENIPQVAMESGHTVKELQTDYLEVVDKDAAKLWFSLCPAAPTNIVTMPSPASPADSVARPNGTAP